MGNNIKIEVESELMKNFMDYKGLDYVEKNGQIYTYNNTEEFRTAILEFSELYNFMNMVNDCNKGNTISFERICSSDVVIAYEKSTKQYVSQEYDDSGELIFYSLHGDGLDEVKRNGYCSREQYYKLKKKPFIMQNIKAYNICEDMVVTNVRSIYSTIDETFYMLIDYNDMYYAIGPRCVESKLNQTDFYVENKGIRKWLFKGVLITNIWSDPNWKFFGNL